jgi:hypothetical protein
MSRSRRLPIVIAACTIACSVVVWWGTGREGFTRWPNERLERADQATTSAEQDVLDELGMGTPPGGSGTIESRFALGLLPGGLDPKHALSVATVVGVVSMSVGAWILTGRMSASRHPKG